MRAPAIPRARTRCPHNADTRVFEVLAVSARCLILCGERGGTRTLDPMIKSHLLYYLNRRLFAELLGQSFQDKRAFIL